MTRYRIYILFCLFSLMLPVSKVWGEGGQQAALGQSAALGQTDAQGQTAPDQISASQPNTLESNASGQTASERTAVITGDYVNLRTASNDSATVIIRLMRGRRVTVLEAGASWTRVRLTDGTEGWLFNKYITIAPVTVASRSMLPSMIPEVLNYAKGFIGTKYVYGGASPQGFDCSGFTLYIYNKYALQLPHEALLQSGIGAEVSSTADLLPGDLVFFKTLGSTRVNHVGIYLGNYQFIHASSGHGSVTISALDTGYYKNCYAGGRRLGIIVSMASRETEQ